MTNYTGLTQAIKDHSEVIAQLDELHASGVMPEGRVKYKIRAGKLYAIQSAILEEMESISTGHHAHILADEIWNDTPGKNIGKQEAFKKALIDVLTLMEATANAESNHRNLIDAIQEHCEVVCKLDELRHKLRATKAEKECYAKSVTRLDELETLIESKMRSIPAEHHAHTVYKEAWHGMPIKNTERENAWKRVLIDVLRNLPA